MTCFISYSYFRHEASIYEQDKWSPTKKGRQFEQFLPMLVRAHQAVWPEWKMRIAHDSRVMELPYWPALEVMSDCGIVSLRKFSHPTTHCGLGGMLERMRPIFNPDAEYVVCRDIDSIPLPRDRMAVEEFIDSEKTVHVIHSASAHAGLMGGTTAFKAGRFLDLVDCNSLETLISKYGVEIDFNKHGADQHLLNRLAGIVGKETLIHDLDHYVGDLSGEVRNKIADVRLSLNEEILKYGDSFSKVIGGCEEPIPPFDFYDKLDLKIMEEIRGCEREAGVDARKIMEEISKL